MVCCTGVAPFSELPQPHHNNPNRLYEEVIYTNGLCASSLYRRDYRSVR